MLKDIHSGKKVSRNIHVDGVSKFRQAAGESAYSGIQEWLLDHFDSQDWVNTTWIAPETWQGTPLMPIWEYYSKIPDHDERHEISALLYGCICYTILFEDERTFGSIVPRVIIKTIVVRSVSPTLSCRCDTNGRASASLLSSYPKIKEVYQVPDTRLEARPNRARQSVLARSLRHPVLTRWRGHTRKRQDTMEVSWKVEES